MTLPLLTLIFVLYFELSDISLTTTNGVYNLVHVLLIVLICESLLIYLIDIST